MKVMISLLLMVLIASTCYHPRGWHMMDDWDHMPWGYGGVFMWLIFLVLIGVIVFFVVRGEKWIKRGGSEETALDILKQRYAKGEITEREFLKIKKDLES